MLSHRTNQPVSHPCPAPGLRVYVAPVQSAPIHILREAPNVVAARISRKRSVREAILVTHGTLKREYLAELLGHKSTRVVQRCLSDSERDEFNAEHLRALKLGVAGLRSVAMAPARAA